MEQRGVLRCRCPLPVTNRVSSHRSSCHLSDSTNTSVSSETMSILLTLWHLQRAAAVSCRPPPGCCQGIACLCAFLYIYYPTPPSHVSPFSSVLMARYSVTSFLVLTCARSLFIGTYKIRSSLQSVNLKSKTGIQYKEFSLNVLLPVRPVYCL